MLDTHFETYLFYPKLVVKHLLSTMYKEQQIVLALTVVHIFLREWGAQQRVTFLQEHKVLLLTK